MRSGRRNEDETEECAAVLRGTRKGEGKVLRLGRYCAFDDGMVFHRFGDD
jgi:hypothetical protein